MSLNRHHKAVALAVLSAGVYLCLRLAFHAQLREAGYTDGGLISYDSYYHFAFARELDRTASFLLFQNPFGSLDQKPLLFNLYSSVLSLVPPLSIPTLFIFDCAVGTLLIGLTSFFILLLMPSLGTLEHLALLFGGGLAFIGVFLGCISESDAVFAAYWGLTYLLNQISTPEIVYHFLFFLGLFGLVHRKNPIVLLVTGTLAFLHPFTAMLFNAALLSAWLHRWFVTRHMVNDRLEMLFFAILSLGLSAGLFGILLPAVSRDALYFKDIYKAAYFHVDIKLYALFLIFPAAFFFGSLLFGSRIRRGPEDFEKFWIFSGIVIFCILMTTSYLYTDRVIQPAHWSRAYPYVLFFGLSSLTQRPERASTPSKAWPPLKLVLLGIALADAALGLTSVRNSLFAEKRPPLFLTQEQSQVIRMARDQSPGRFLYLRDSSNRGTLGDVEYAVMALTSQKGFLGHAFFSPFLRSLSDALYPERDRFNLYLGLVRESDYILLDRALLPRLPSMPWEVLYEGEELVFVKNPRNRGSSPGQESRPVPPLHEGALQKKGDS
jgi:hypothetical protein